MRSKNCTNHNRIMSTRKTKTRTLTIDCRRPRNSAKYSHPSNQSFSLFFCSLSGRMTCTNFYHFSPSPKGIPHKSSKSIRVGKYSIVNRWQESHYCTFRAACMHYKLSKVTRTPIRFSDDRVLGNLMESDATPSSASARMKLKQQIWKTGSLKLHALCE